MTYYEELTHKHQTTYIIGTALLVAILITLHPQWAIWPKWLAKLFSATLIVGLSGGIVSNYITNICLLINDGINRWKGVSDLHTPEQRTLYIKTFFLWSNKMQKPMWIIMAAILSWILMSA